ncbi:MAG TPA: TonB-dependent receptor [Chitinophaga sp.]|uniref:TonB-dependent receptor n=1 Tax=Chitinophaga sp. TaxID=1869181 RepID=UPI002CDC4439|nr:TonB-dependent receptor [Chitinophaga sp.]HVI48590.1 TonB-dependent receptor [Chitinophaga sp.]
MGFRKLLFTFSLLLATIISYAQVTTGGMNGYVKDEKGEALIGATVKAVHTPSGTVYGTTTQEGGRYNIPNMRVGGPYTVTVSFISYTEQKVENINLPLGQTFKIDFRMKSASTSLNEIVVKGKQDNTFNSSRTGAATYITKDQLQSLPTLNRGIADFTKLTPQSGKGMHFAGRNALFNTLTVDGSLFNNAFGLSELPGGSTNSQPISLDAIDQIQVNLAPYDVKLSGFTGASINAVTKSGTNEFSGSVYTFIRSNDLTGGKVEGVKLAKDVYNMKQYGFRVGGPIIKNKLFFFINGELERRNSPGANWRSSKDSADATLPGVSKVRTADLDLVRKTLIDNYGYDPGAYEGYNFKQNNEKATVRIDWNISEKHKFTFRYNYMNSFRDIAASGSNSNSGRGPNANNMLFQNTTYRQYSKINSFVVELNSTFSNKMSNSLSLTYSGFRDYRTTPGGAFPLIDIEDGKGKNYISAGSEPFSAVNKLNQDLFQFTDNFNLYKNKHTFTFGVSGEYFRFSNAFAQLYLGQFRYKDLNTFITATKDPTVQPLLYQLSYSAIKGDPAPAAKLSAATISAYAQDEFQVNDKLKLTYGVRFDVPFYPTKLMKNPTIDTVSFRNGEHLDVSVLPKAQLLISPRVGFNWDVKGDQTLQVRGGTGIFTGRIPYVWAVNQAGQNGLLYGQEFTPNPPANDPKKSRPFSPDPGKYIPENPQTPPSALINVMSPDFKYPQIWRSNLAVDVVLPGKIVATFEGIYTKDINAVFHRDANLVNPTGKSVGPGARDTFPIGSANRVSPKATNAIVLDNTTKGWSYSLSAQLSRTFDFGLTATAAYAYQNAKDITSSPGSQAASAFNGNQIVNDPNNPVLSYTGFLVKHRVVATLSYKIAYAKMLATTVSVIYEGSPAADAFGNTRLSYVYAGNMNRDGSSGNNDLIYVPKDKSEIILIPDGPNDKRTADQIWTDLDQFISKEKYLNSRRGQFAERNGGQFPWWNHFDVKIIQDIDFAKIAPKSKSKLQATLDIINVGNLLNSNWGVVKTPNTIPFLSYRDSNGPGGQARYSFTNIGNPFITSTDILSRWQMQIGIRYLFN